MSFSNLKNNRQNAISKLNSALTKINSNSNEKTVDNRIWYPEVDKSGNGSAIIRFLPPPEGEDVPFVRIFSHSFQGPTGLWYIENSLTTIGQQDPVGDLNRELWNSGSEANKEIVRKQKRKVNFYSNIYVIKDPANPANEGKVFLYKYGKKIFDKWNDLMNPQFEDEEAVNAFDLWGGANFRLRIRNFEGYRNYDKSEFDKPSALLDDDAAMEAIWKQEYSLQAFLAADQFKSYDELKTKLNRVLGLDKVTAVPRTVADELEEESAPRFKARETAALDADVDAEDMDLEKLFESIQD